MTVGLRIGPVEHPPTRGQRRLHLLREVLLTAGAVAGVVCLLATLAGVLFDVRPVVFRSGSMSPAIETGALAFSHDVPASAIQVGDVVTVKARDGVNVTHRVRAVSLSDGHATLELKGDANRVSDDQAYVVTHAPKVLFAVPRAGYAVAWLSGSGGMFLGGLVVGAVLLTLLRRSQPGGQLAVAGVAVLVGMVGVGGTGVMDTQAYYTDTATAVSGTFRRPAPPPPAPHLTGSCTTSNGANPYVVSFTWSGSTTDPDSFVLRYSNSALHPDEVLPGNLRTVTTAAINNESGEFWLVAVVGGTESAASNHASYSGQGGNKKCTVG